MLYKIDWIMKFTVVRFLLFICFATIAGVSDAQLSVTGELEATTFTGTGLTINGAINANTLNISGILTASSFTGTYLGTILTPGQTNITSLGQLSYLSVSGMIQAGIITAPVITSASGSLLLKETGGELGETGIYLFNKNGSNGPVIYTNPTPSWIDVVDIGFLSQSSNSQTNLRFEHRAVGVIDALNTNGEMQVIHVTNNGSPASPATAFAAIGSFVTSITSSNAIKFSGGTGASSFSTSGAGTLVLGGASSTGAITLGSSSGAQTVNIGTGAGASLINIGTGSSTPSVTIGKASTIASAGLRLGNARFTINKPTVPTIGLNANTTATVAQILDAGIIGFATNANRVLTLPSAAGASGLIQSLPGVPAIGDVFSFVVFNTNNNTVTLQAGGGTTIVGPATIAATASGNSRTFYCRVTGITTNSETMSCY
jgi:hypothetical protein